MGSGNRRTTFHLPIYRMTHLFVSQFPGTIIITKQAGGSSQGFNFTGSGGIGNFSLCEVCATPPDSRSFSQPPGTYTETLPFSWELSSTSSFTTGGPINTGGATINLTFGATVTCNL